MSIHEDIAIAQFENVNSLRMYPFYDGGNLIDRRGKVLPSDIIVDIKMVVPAVFPNPESGIVHGYLPNVNMTSVHLSGSMVSACFVSYGGTKPVAAMSITVSTENFKPYVPYMMNRLYGSDDIGGIVTFGDIDFPGQPETYILDHAMVDPCCIVSAKPCGVRSFVDRRSGEKASGDVSIDFSGYISTNRDGRSIALSLEEGAAEELMSECFSGEGVGDCGATPIRSINGVEPDDDGNIVLWFH